MSSIQIKIKLKKKKKETVKVQAIITLKSWAKELPQKVNIQIQGPVHSMSIYGAPTV